MPKKNNLGRGLISLLNLRTLPLLWLGFSSGLPLALSGATLQAWFASENISIMTIGLLSLASQPYAYKFLWAALLDRYTPKFLKMGKRKAWIVLMQLSLAVCISLMGLWGAPQSHGLTLALLAFVLAFLSATQDIAIDAYRTDILKPIERGVGGSFFIFAYRIAMLVSGGLAMIFADHYGWQMTYFLMASLVLLLIPFNFFNPPPLATPSPVSLKQAFIQPFCDFFSRPDAKGCLAFLILYKMGDAFTISLSSAFLIKSLHYSLSIVGSIHKIVGIGSTILGGILGGFWLARLNLYRALLYFGLGQALCSFLFMLLAITGQNLSLLIITVFADNFLGGMSAVALLAFITQLCNKKFSAAQFALFSAFSSFSRVFIGPLAGITAQALGWKCFFFLSFFVSLPGLGLLLALRNSYDAFRIKL